MVHPLSAFTRLRVISIRALLITPLRRYGFRLISVGAWLPRQILCRVNPPGRGDPAPKRKSRWFAMRRGVTCLSRFRGNALATEWHRSGVIVVGIPLSGITNKVMFMLTKVFFPRDPEFSGHLRTTTLPYKATHPQLSRSETGKDPKPIQSKQGASGTCPLSMSNQTPIPFGRTTLPNRYKQQF